MSKDKSKGKSVARGRCSKETTSQRCDSCLSIIAKGKIHKCNASTRLNNLKTLIAKSPPGTGNKIVSSTLKEVISNGNAAELSFTQHHGKPLNLIVKASNKEHLKEPPVITSDMKKIQTRFSLTQNQTIGIASMIRVATNKRNIIESNLKEKLSAESHCLDQFFEVKQCKFKVTKSGKSSDFNQAVVYCTNLNGLINYIKAKRNVSNVRLKFGINGGGGSLKICMSIQSVETEMDSDGKHRQKYEDGVASKYFQDSGVKKLILLGLAEKVQENHENVKQLWSDIGIDNVNGTITADIKLANIMTGITSSASSYPCTCCNISKGKLDGSSTLRTIENITENYEKWVSAGAKKDLAKNYMCCIALPLFKTDQDKTILDIMPPPELHLLLGVVNGLINHMSSEFEETVISWTKMCNVTRDVTHSGAGFNGNSCKKLLDKLDLLRSICLLGCIKFVQVLSHFKLVVKACFSKTLDPEFTRHINDFKISYLDLEISVTPKVHCIFEHVKEFCKKHQVGLGVFSEQAFESVHFEFKTIWNKYKVHATHVDYEKHLLRAVCEFNGLHC